MTEHRPTTDLDALLAAANPLVAERAAALPLSDAQAELRAALIEHDPGPARAPSASRPRRPRRRLAARLTVAIAVAFAALMAVLSLSGGSSGRSGTVWAAELVRFAEASPLVLLDADGWHVEYADEQSKQEGELRFLHGAAPAASNGSASVSAAGQREVPTTIAELNWRGGDLSLWTRDRAASAKVRTRAPVLGTTARVYQYDGGRPGHQDITALWRYDGRVMEFRAGAQDIDDFKALLAKLRRVDTDAWLSALPASAVKTTDRSHVIETMLEGVTVPPGFDPTTIRGDDLTKDRYQLGAAVVGTVACTWLKRWSDARAAGDKAGAREAITAMATAKDWPVVTQMAKSGAYPQVLESLVAAMPTGRYYGRPLEGDADPALGCPSLGIPLAAPGDRVNGG